MYGLNNILLISINFLTSYASFSLYEFSPFYLRDEKEQKIDFSQYFCKFFFYFMSKIFG